MLATPTHAQGRRYQRSRDGWFQCHIRYEMWHTPGRDSVEIMGYLRLDNWRAPLSSVLIGTDFKVSIHSGRSGSVVPELATRPRSTLRWVTWPELPECVRR